MQRKQPIIVAGHKAAFRGLFIAMECDKFGLRYIMARALHVGHCLHCVCS